MHRMSDKYASVIMMTPTVLAADVTALGLESQLLDGCAWVWGRWVRELQGCTTLHGLAR
jgi:hypothetical protein